MHIRFDHGHEMVFKKIGCRRQMVGKFKRVQERDNRALFNALHAGRVTFCKAPDPEGFGLGNGPESRPGLLSASQVAP